MARKKAYTKKLAVIDLILLIITGGGWMFGIVIRELYMHS